MKQQDDNAVLKMEKQYMPPSLSGDSSVSKRSTNSNVKVEKIQKSENLKDWCFISQEMRIQIKEGTIVINDYISTDFSIYKQIYNLEI